MNFSELLKFLKDNEIDLSLQDNNLRIKAKKGVVRDEKLLNLIRDHKQLLVDHIKSGQYVGGSGSLLPPIVAMSGAKDLLLTHQQKRLWFLSKSGQDRGAYNMPVAFDIQGSPCLEALEVALVNIVYRHQSLRMNFSTQEDGSPAIVLQQKPSKCLICTDAKNLDDCLAQLQDLASRAFDLEHDPLYRFNLIKYSDRRYKLSFVFHHIIFDGISLALFLDEFKKNYAEILQTGNVEKRPDVVQYLDYSSWLKKGEVEARLAEAKKYWLNHLSGFVYLNLPLDKLRTPNSKRSGGVVSLSMDLEFSRSIDTAVRKMHTTPFAFFMFCWQVLLARYSNQKDIIVGTVIGNRWPQEVEETLGFFANTLLLRTELDFEATALANLKLVEKVCIDALIHQSAPFDQIVSELGASDSANGQMLISAFLSYLEIQESKLSIEGLDVQESDGKDADPKFDIVLNISKCNDAYSCVISYDAGLFHDSTVLRMAANLEILMKSLIRSPDSALKDQAYLSDAEKNLIQRWSAGKSIANDRPCIERFRDVVGKQPHAIALISPDADLTYQDLDKKSDLVAKCLQRYGIKAGDAVGILCTKSWQTIALMLGIFKIRAAYVPMDPALPVDRLQYMIADSRAQMIVRNTDRVEISSSNEFIQIDIDKLFIDGPDALQMESSRPDDLAYIIYTSGSTGQPKGVQVTQKGLGPLIDSVRDVVFKNEKHIVYQFASLSFDVSVSDIFGTLCNGSTLYTENVNPVYDRSWVDSINKFEVTCLSVPPSVLSVVSPSEFPGVRVIWPIGEAVSDALAKRWNHIRFINAYGPTECTVVNTFYEFTPDAQYGQTPPIGKPFYNNTVFIVDEHMSLLPIGALGELIIGGDGVALGYKNLPDLTRSKFVTLDFGLGAERYYRTGDNARLLPDGNIEFLGRSDNQVKVRGYRIELGEIEAQLEHIPGVSRSCVLIEEIGGAKTLVAFLTVSGALIAVQDIREQLAKGLPHYMVPGKILIIDAFPLNNSGKIDRRRLMQLNRSENAKNYEELTFTEAAVKEIWLQLLGLQEVSKNANFFELGGHSLLVMNLVAEIEARFGVQIDAGDLFFSPTIAAHSFIIDEKKRLSLPAIVPGDEGVEHWPLSPQQKSIVQSLMNGAAGTEMNIQLTYALNGEIRVDLLEKALAGIVTKHAAFRTNLAQVGNEFIQRVRLSESNCLFLLNVSEDQIDELIEADGNRDFNLHHDWLYRFTLMEYAPHRRVFLATFHHFVFDGESSGIFLQELAALYNTLLVDDGANVEPPSLQYTDYCTWLQHEDVRNLVEDAEFYWVDHLRSYPGMSGPKTEAQTVKSARTLTSSLLIDLNTSRMLRDFSRKNKSTPFAVFFMLLAMQMIRVFDTQDIAVTTGVANRWHRDIQKMIGYLSNTVVLRLRLDPNASFVDNLNEAKQVTFAALKYQIMPFSILKERMEKIDPIRFLGLEDISISYREIDENPVYLGQVEVMGRLKNVADAVNGFALHIEFEKEEYTLSLYHNVGRFGESFGTSTLNGILEVITRILSNPLDPLSTYIRQ